MYPTMEIKEFPSDEERRAHLVGLFEACETWQDRRALLDRLIPDMSFSRQAIFYAWRKCGLMGNMREVKGGS